MAERKKKWHCYYCNSYFNKPRKCKCCAGTGKHSCEVACGCTDGKACWNCGSINISETKYENY